MDVVVNNGILVGCPIPAVPILRSVADISKSVVKVIIRHRAAFFDSFTTLLAVTIPPGAFARIIGSGQGPFNFESFTH